MLAKLWWRLFLVLRSHLPCLWCLPQATSKQWSACLLVVCRQAGPCLLVLHILHLIDLRYNCNRIRLAELGAQAELIMISDPIRSSHGMPSVSNPLGFRKCVDAMRSNPLSAMKACA